MALNQLSSQLLRRGACVGNQFKLQARAFDTTQSWLHKGYSACHTQQNFNRSSLSTPLPQNAPRHFSKSSILGSTNSINASLDPTSYATTAVQLAQQGLDQQTFGVGGVLLDKQGTVIQQMHNNVIQNACISDPTAHGERQLISWYYENAQKLPPANELTIVTSLDPCLMCTGSFLTSGINVAVVSHDNWAGIDWKSDQQFTGIPQGIREQAIQQFSYLGVRDSVPPRPFAGPTTSVFYDGSITADVDKSSLDIFNKSAGIVHGILNKEDPHPVNILDKGPGSPELRLLQQYWALAATRVADIGTAVGREVLYGLMAAVAFGSSFGFRGWARNSAALMDPFNNVLLIMPHGPTPLDTPFMMLTRAYAACRRAASMAQDGALPHPKRCRFVLFNGPGTSSTDVLNLGAFGSTLEGQSCIEDSLSYFHPQQSPEELKAMIANFPPLYSKTIGIDPVQLERWL